jgi:uncharacterized membrane protein
MQKYRIEGLSDLVFGLALSIGSLAMINQNVNDEGDIISGMIWFIFGFFIIVNVWISYSNVMAERRVETELDFRLNLVLLLLVSIEPYLLYLMGKEDSGMMGFSTTIYAIDIGLIMLVIGLFHHRRMDGESIDDKIDKADRAKRDRYFIVASFFLISAIPMFWSTEIFDMKARYFIWALSIVPSLLWRFVIPRMMKNEKG